MTDLITRPDYEALVRSLAGRSILVVGDLMMDEYLLGGATRVSPESPVLVVDVERQDFKPGGAANVVNNVLAMSGRAYVAGVVGDDECGARLRAELAERGAATAGILTDPSRPTTRKTRVLAHGQQVIRVDRESVAPVSSEIANALLEYVAAEVSAVDAVLVSDYRKGVLTPETAQGVISLARAAGKPVVANPKPRSAPWLAGAQVLSLNQLEAEQLAGSPLPDEEHELAAFGARLVAELGVGTLVITRGSRGLSYWTRETDHRTVPAHAVEVYDVAGAGDTTITAMTLALAAGADEYGAACVANHAGACVVRKRGVAVVSLEELIDDWE
jgi:D-beta-D-heptose 7-phosphate kinase/D-beta-D-heptose 1-phosphate adenosyltransferase